MNSKGDKVPREKPHAKFAPCVQCVNQSQVLATAPIEKFLVPKSALSSLRSRGVVMAPITVNNDDTDTPCLDGAADIISAGPRHSDLLQALDAIGLKQNAGVAQRCTHQQEVTVFPLISSLSSTEQIRYMRLLRGIARALGVPPFGSTAQILATVHRAAREQSIHTPGSLPGHDTDMADRWLPNVSELTDMAVQINIRSVQTHEPHPLHDTAREAISPWQASVP